MRFAVPQFIEREAKIIGPFSFRQFIFIIVAGAICFVLYFQPIPILVWLALCFLILGGALALTFLKIGGRPLWTVIKNFFLFNVSPKTYIWKRKISPKKKKKKKKPEEKEAEKEAKLKIVKKSKLEKVAKEVETKSR